MRAAERPVHVHDIHATILWMMGLDHLKTTYRHNGQNERPTVLAGQVIKEILAAPPPMNPFLLCWAALVFVIAAAPPAVEIVVGTGEKGFSETRVNNPYG